MQCSFASLPSYIEPPSLRSLELMLESARRVLVDGRVLSFARVSLQEALPLVQSLPFAFFAAFRVNEKSLVIQDHSLRWRNQGMNPLLRQVIDPYHRPFYMQGKMVQKKKKTLQRQ